MPATPKPVTPSRLARLQADLTLAQAARFLDRTPRYLGRLERANSFPLHLARRLAWRYGARLDDFLPQPLKGGATRKRAGPAKCDAPARPRRR